MKVVSLRPAAKRVDVVPGRRRSRVGSSQSHQGCSYFNSRMSQPLVLSSRVFAGKEIVARAVELADIGTSANLSFHALPGTRERRIWYSRTRSGRNVRCSHESTRDTFATQS